MKNELLLATCASLFLGCTDISSKDATYTKDINSKSSDFVTLGCDAFQAIKTPIGDLQNNVWNQHSAKNFDWQQCLIKREQSGKTEYGWHWKWPENGDEIYAQPQITLGQTPWVGHKSPYEGYPIALSTLDALEFDYDMEITGNSKLNLTATLWMTNSPDIPKKADKSTITTEFMIWTYSNEGFYSTPAGKKLDEVSFDGIEWEVWVNKHWHDTSGLNDNNWTYIAFRAKKHALDIRYDAADLIQHSIKKGYVDGNTYIADIQLGNEVMSGSGQAWLRRFNVEIAKK